MSLHVPFPFLMDATNAQIRRHYDSLLPWYRILWGDHLHHGLFLTGTEAPHQAQLQMLEYCASLVGSTSPTEALDIGCGHGATCMFLARRFGCSTLGITISPRQAARAQKCIATAHIGSKVKVVVADVVCYPIGNDRFDLVWLMESSEHFRDKVLLLRRASGALRRGGKLLIAAWTGSMDSRTVRNVAEAFLCPSLQTAEDYREQLASVAMKVVTHADLSKYVWRTWEICKARTAAARLLSPILPKEFRRFLGAFETILQAFKCGDLSYSILVAEK